MLERIIVGIVLAIICLKLYIWFADEVYETEDNTERTCSGMIVIGFICACIFSGIIRVVSVLAILLAVIAITITAVKSEQGFLRGLAGILVHALAIPIVCIVLLLIVF